MPDFKGRKDFPEVADEKIKIGDYSGTNRLAISDIYSPKGEPELRDQIMEPVKGETNNYDSPILSQQPVIVLSDTESEIALIKAIEEYVEKETDYDAEYGHLQEPYDAQMGGEQRGVRGPKMAPDFKRNRSGPPESRKISQSHGMMTAADEEEAKTNIGEGHQSEMGHAVDTETGERFLTPPRTPTSDVASRKILKSDDLEEGSRSWSYQG